MDSLVIQLLGLGIILISLVNIHHILASSKRTKVWVPQKVEVVQPEPRPMRPVGRAIDVDTVELGRSKFVPRLTAETTSFDDLYGSSPSR